MDHKNDKYADKILSTKNNFTMSFLVRRETAIFISHNIAKSIIKTNKLIKHIHIKYIFPIMLFNIMILLIGTL
ncbi:hypothetical protein DRK65_21665 [Salmonella enterica subsp. enterica serovar Fulica]|nr:hypothetical protein [Salmonella enterica]EBV0853261.1 hypothetical protein [Salmonella enterica subsp. enterica serovar Fulica]ECC3677174.1 hypothetical protein [Salmonella enterica subsp. enterica serovar Miami]EBX2562114.1 hypothetical protein [Salmonella enterica subsp. enterica serovar Fulica]ECA3149565.1 hypothetical protein [Salmonella enterica subsp. enterica serovar Fulica]